MTGAIIAAGGSGERLGGEIPKGMRELAGRPLYQYSLTTVEDCEHVDASVLVVPEAYVNHCREQVEGLGLRKPTQVVAGGTTRQHSVRLGLNAMTRDMDWVAVHDAARPRARSGLWRQVIAAAHTHGGAIAAEPATDTLKQAEAGVIQRTLDRSSIWQAQTPQVFRTDLLRSALTDAPPSTDEAEAMERAGHPVWIVPAPADNFKISTPSDWEFAEFLVATNRL